MLSPFFFFFYAERVVAMPAVMLNTVRFSFRSFSLSDVAHPTNVTIEIITVVINFVFFIYYILVSLMVVVSNILF